LAVGSWQLAVGSIFFSQFLGKFTNLYRVTIKTYCDTVNILPGTISFFEYNVPAGVITATGMTSKIKKIQVLTPIKPYGLTSLRVKDFSAFTCFLQPVA